MELCLGVAIPHWGVIRDRQWERREDGTVIAREADGRRCRMLCPTLVVGGTKTRRASKKSANSMAGMHGVHGLVQMNVRSTWNYRNGDPNDQPLK